MRLGTTSYIYPADIITNVRKLARFVDDVELIIFQAEEGGKTYPDREVVQELGRIGKENGLTYTVHMPLDLSLAGDRPALDTALGVIERTMELDPHGYIVHLDGAPDPASHEFTKWVENSVRSLEHIGNSIGDPAKICVENLDDQTPLMLDTILEQLPVSCCVDVGHLWKQGFDPVPCLDVWLNRTRVVHLHGVGTRDHERLSHMASSRLDPVVDILLNRLFEGVLTFEIFSEADLRDSLQAFRGALGRIGAAAG